MPRVALFTHKFPSREHPYIVEWARGLVHSGIDLTIYSEQPGDGPILDGKSTEDDFWRRVKDLNSLDQPWSTFKRNFINGVKNVFRIPKATRLIWKEYPGKPLTVLRKLYEYLPILGQQFDIVHFNAPQLAVRRFELGQLLSAKTLVSFRGQDFSFDALRFTPLLNKADHLHFISQHLLGLAQAQGYDSAKHTLIPPLVDTDYYRPANKMNNPKSKSEIWNFFSAGRFTWVKGWEFALQAVALLVERGWDIHYSIAGDGELREMILYTCNQLNIADRVRLLGWLSPGQVRDWMQQADVYLLASVDEAFNNSVLQAQACGTPVVCSDAGGLPENNEDKVTGLLFKRRDAWDMAEKIESLITNPDLLLQMSINSRKRVETNFSIKTGVDAFGKLYESVAMCD